MGHEAGRLGRRYAALMDAHSHTAGDMNAPARRVYLRILTSLAKAKADRFDRFRHGDNAANLLGADEYGLHGNFTGVMECWSNKGLGSWSNGVVE